MRKSLAIIAAVASIFGLFLAGKIFLGGFFSPFPQPANTERQPAATTPKRIISLAPSLTEILFALGLGGKVVGVTRYCDYPAEALSLPKVGGYDSPSFEALMELKPNIVVALPEHLPFKKRMEALGLKVLLVDNRTIGGILNSIETIGKACGAGENATRITSDLKARMDRIKNAGKGKARPKVLVTIGRNMGSGSIKDIYAAGRKGFYNEMIELAGGVNAYEGDIAFPVLSRESIVRIDPDYIFDMISDMAEKGYSEADVIGQWSPLKQVSAVKNRHIFVFGEDYVVIPGPRFILILEKMAGALNPGALKKSTSKPESMGHE